MHFFLLLWRIRKHVQAWIESRAKALNVEAVEVDGNSIGWRSSLKLTIMRAIEDMQTVPAELHVEVRHH
jgi:hypothetical protein